MHVNMAVPVGGTGGGGEMGGPCGMWNLGRGGGGDEGSVTDSLIHKSKCFFINYIKISRLYACI